MPASGSHAAPLLVCSSLTTADREGSAPTSVDNPSSALLVGQYRRMRPSPLPPELGVEFSIARARSLGVKPSRLRAGDLSIPFHGTRVVNERVAPLSDRFDESRARELALIRALAKRLLDGQFFSHRSAGLIWGAPLPHRADPDLHIGVVRPRRAPRVNGVVGHSFVPGRVRVQNHHGLQVLSPACTFATLGRLPLASMVAIGDHLVRKYRKGVGRKDVGKPPLTTLGEIGEVLNSARWVGARELRQASLLLREDSWSPRESIIRVMLVLGGLPEPGLNVDLFDRSGAFLACVDMVYPKFGVIIEYQGVQHSNTYAADIERIERLRAEGWVVIQVTKVLASQPRQLVARVAKELRARGWQA